MDPTLTPHHSNTCCSCAEAVHKAKKAKKASTPLSADMLAAIGGFGDGEQDEVLGQYELSGESW